MNKRILSIILVLSMLFLTACDIFGGKEQNVEAPLPTGDSTAGEPLTKTHATDNVFTMNYSSQNSMNPLTTDSALNLLFLPLVYESLYTVDEQFVSHPTRLLDKAVSEDGKSWLIYINTDVKFHDGKNLTADDVYYSLNRAMYTDRYRARLRAAIKGISPIGNDLVAITLYEANTQLPALLNIPIIPDGAIGEDLPSGTGAYKLDIEGKKLSLDKSHPDSEIMPLDTIYLKEFRGADEIITSFEESVLDLVVNDPTGLSELGYGAANEVRYFNTTTMHYLGFNMESAFFLNANYRAAMNYIVNRSYVVTNLMGGSGAASTLPISPVSPLYNATFAQNYDYSIEKCKTMLANANVKDHDDDGKLEYMLTGIPMEINLRFIVNSESALKVTAARRIAEDMRGLGLTVNLAELSWSDYITALNKGDYDMYYAEVMLTPDFDLSSILADGGALNYGGGAGSGEVIKQYLAAGEEDRMAACEMMCQYIISNAPIVTIAFEKREFITHRGVVSGVAPTQYNIFNKFENWTIDL